MTWVNHPKRQREGRVTTSTLSPNTGYLHRRIISDDNVGAYGRVGLGMVDILCIGLER